MQPKCPKIPFALISYLQQVFPDQAVDPSVKDPAVAFGNAEVVRHLTAKHHEQEEDFDVST